MSSGQYRRTTHVGHPIADSNGKLYRHRRALYDDIGEGPHVCHWCGWGGLDWHLDRDDPDYLVADHLDGNKASDDPANLVPAHTWCNNYRAQIEAKGIPWETFKDQPPADRPALRNTYTGDATEAAYKLASAPAPVVSDPSPGPPPTAGTETQGRPLRNGFPSWAVALDATPPTWLQDTYPWLLEELGQ